MKVRELLERLEVADPDAQVLVFPPYADVSDGGVLGDVIVPDVWWNRETGVCSGSIYETFYPSVAEPRASPYLSVRVERVKVVLVGEELGNLHLLLKAQSPE